jgi:hypothetical protein
VGSNPTLSATTLPIVDYQLPIVRPASSGAKIDNWQSAIDNPWRGAGVVELAALEML